MKILTKKQAAELDILKKACHDATDEDLVIMYSNETYSSKIDKMRRDVIKRAAANRGITFWD